ncbi:MAG: DNA polymerase IV, partial [Kiritimatiellae bacterium]|nr:DNA polymerase IV [Kiritimatiellia bacterium]
MHIDMDAFYASIEQRDHPELRGKPVIVGSRASQRGVVSTCSYEARRFGVHSAMPMRQALECCPEGIVVPPRMAHYEAVSRAVFAIFESYTPLVEGLSVDEAFLDVTGVRRLWGTPREIALALKQRIAQELGLTCSVGIAPNKSLAKIASEEKKPDGLFEVPSDPTALLAWLGKKSLRVLWGVGPKCAAALAQIGLKTVRDLQSVNPERLRQVVTPALADHLLALAFGRDERPVLVYTPDKSYSREHTYPEDVQDAEVLRKELLWIVQDVG